MNGNARSGVNQKTIRISLLKPSDFLASTSEVQVSVLNALLPYPLHAGRHHRGAGGCPRRSE